LQEKHSAPKLYHAHIILKKYSTHFVHIGSSRLKDLSNVNVMLRCNCEAALQIDTKCDKQHNLIAVKDDHFHSSPLKYR